MIWKRPTARLTRVSPIHFEADASTLNLFRDALGSRPFTIGKDGCVRSLEAPGLGVEIDEKFLARHPVIEGPGYV